MVQVLVLTMVAVDGCDVGHAAVKSFMILQRALAQWKNGPGGVPPRVPAGWWCS